MSDELREEIALTLTLRLGALSGVVMKASTADSLADAILPFITAAEARGAAARQARIVAWLRASNKSRDYDLSAAIERDEHLPKGKP